MPAGQAGKPSPLETLLGLATGYWVSRCLHVVAELGVADVLGEVPQSAAELAEATGANADALARVLRLLAAHGVFEMRDGRLAHSAASRLLRTDHPQSLRPLVRVNGIPIFWESYGKLEHAVRTGLPAVNEVSPGGLWSYFAGHPEESRIHDQAMTAKSQGQIAGVLAAYSFAGFRVIGDIGGGRGHLLRAVLAAAPEATGVLFDLPHVIRQASGIASERLSFVPGDFFKDALPVCDAYLMMDVINTWSDEEAARILRNVRRAAPAQAKLLMIEAVIHEGLNPSWAKLLDIQMLAMLKGRQRTLGEHEKLLADSGFRLGREIDLGNFSIVEATPV
jgi:hypothetical protein